MFYSCSSAASGSSGDAASVYLVLFFGNMSYRPFPSDHLDKTRVHIATTLPIFKLEDHKSVLESKLFVNSTVRDPIIVS